MHPISTNAETPFTPAQQALLDIWQGHTHAEFVAKIASEHLYWDQASVLVQIGLLDPAGLPIVGAAAARRPLEVVSLGA